MSDFANILVLDKKIHCGINLGGWGEKHRKKFQKQHFAVCFLLFITADRSL